MTKVLIGMGSNIDPELHLLQAAEDLRTHFTSITFSEVYRSKAVGMEGDDFLNACCLFDYEKSQADLKNTLKNIENEHGRDRSEGSWKPRTLDLDILIFHDEVMDDDIYRYAHTFVPASSLLPLNSPSQDGFAELILVNLKL